MDYIRSDLNSFANKIKEIVKEYDMMDGSKDSWVTISHGQSDGSISIQAFLNDETAQNLKIPLKGKIGSDVFLVNCSGRFTLQPRKLYMSCSIVNEDGMPLAIVDSEELSLMHGKVNEMSMKITKEFDSP